MVSCSEHAFALIWHGLMGQDGSVHWVVVQGGTMPLHSDSRSKGLSPKTSYSRRVHYPENLLGFQVYEPNWESSSLIADWLRIRALKVYPQEV